MYEKIDERLAVARQPALDAFPAIAEAGFAKVINNRREGEDPDQPTSEAEAQAAAAAGLGYAHVPVAGGAIDEPTVRRFQKELAEADGPVFAHCQSGKRSLVLWAIGEVLDGRMRTGEVADFGARHGFDLSNAVTWLENNGHTGDQP